jgi:outer membrane protein TolC
MTLSFSQDVYTEMVQVQQAQIQALQNKIAELQARIDFRAASNNLKPIYTMEQQSILFI